MERKSSNKHSGGVPYSKTISQKYKRTREAKLCLLICSMFPRNFSIPVEELVTYGMGLKLFEDVHNLIQARSRIHELIKIINDQKILLLAEQDESGNQYVKMQVGAHELARKIATSYGLEVPSRETIVKWFPNGYIYKNCDVISLVLIRIKWHLINLECPELAILQLKYRQDSENLPLDFFDGMKQLLVLSLDVPSLPQSIHVLKHLRTLHLKVLKLKDMYLIGYFEHLEFLTISTSSLTDIPRQMGLLLRNLRLLDLRNMNLAYIPPGVLSRMLKLEELYLPLSFRRWGCKAKKEDDDHDLLESIDCSDKERIHTSLSEVDDEEERINASLGEIAFLSLNALEACVLRASMLPKNSPVFKHIQKFKILVESNVPFQKGSLNKLQVTGDAYDIKDSGICDFLSRTEDLSLIRIRNLKNFMYQLSDYDFPQLKKVIITECHELEYLGGTTENWIPYASFCELKSLHLSMLSNLKEIWHGPRPVFRWFENLGEIKIRFCHKLKYVFPLSMAGGLIRLKSIEILDCNKMVGIFYDNKEDDRNYVIDFVEQLYLHSLPNLVSVLVHTVDGVHDANEMVSNSVTRLDERCVNNDQELTSAPTSLQVSFIKDKDVTTQMEMYCAFSSELIDKRLTNLKKLRISFCDALSVIFFFKENHVTSSVLNSLEELELHGLRNLRHIWYRIPSKIVAFQKLRVLILSECRNLNLFSPRIANLLVQLQKIQISRCEMMKEIVAEDDEKEEEITGCLY
ncbi:disease resistance protein RPS2-like isoform X2 [Euphorbia lathyris]|uniref:disease resistance protein RPS2-like isoform X2 n=1 Tax=Euphorbia lathyris TaxID=212925 RepID=UPI0033137E1E